MKRGWLAEVDYRGRRLSVRDIVDECALLLRQVRRCDDLEVVLPQLLLHELVDAERSQVGAELHGPLHFGGPLLHVVHDRIHAVLEAHEDRPHDPPGALGVPYRLVGGHDVVVHLEHLINGAEVLHVLLQGLRLVPLLRHGLRERGLVLQRLPQGRREDAQLLDLAGLQDALQVAQVVLAYALQPRRHQPLRRVLVHVQYLVHESRSKSAIHIILYCYII